LFVFLLCLASAELSSKFIPRTRRSRTFSQEDYNWIARFNAMWSMLCIHHRSNIDNVEQSWRDPFLERFRYDQRRRISSNNV